MGFYSQEGEFTPNIESLPLSHTHTEEKKCRLKAGCP
jgi:hypothetical protein